jgi:outer membrane protein OmpA-like peptidoglycan-associated protein
MLVSISLKAQDNFTPQRLEQAVNTEYSELNPLISPDGKTLYFSRLNHPENFLGDHNTSDIWYSTLQPDSSWSIAKRMPRPFNTARYNNLFSISSNGTHYLVNGEFKGKKARWIKRGLSVVTKEGDSAWSKPKRLKVPALSRKNRGLFSNAYLSEDEEYLVTCFAKKWEGEILDMYISARKKNGKYTKPKPIPHINDYGSVEAPFLTVDKQYMFFSADNNRDGFNDIMRVRKVAGEAPEKNIKREIVKWTDPVMMSDSLNSTAWDSYYHLNKKGSWAYFCSDRNTSTKSDIYRVKVFEENPFVDVSGIVFNKTKNAPLQSKYKFVISADGKVIDTAVINPDSASYAIRLPLGRRYSIAAVADKFVSTPEYVDVSTRREYMKTNLNLNVTPVPYVLVQGRFLNKKTNGVLPASSRPKLAVDGVIVDSVELDYNNMTYTAKIPHGKSYSLQVLADKYNPIVQYLDLKNVDDYQEYKKDLMAEEIRMLAVVTGKIINKKTNKPMSSKVDYDVKVNDVEKGNAKINRETAEYSIEIPIGQKYVINASANKYFPSYENVDLSMETTPVKIYKDLYLAPLEVGSSVKLNNVFFETGKAILKPESFIELDKVVSFLNEYPEVKIEIGGHTDNVGKPDKNQILSQNRANAVADYIKRQGISDDRISAKGYGQNKPVVPNTTPQNKAKNRRVEFTILDI